MTIQTLHDELLLLLACEFLPDSSGLFGSELLFQNEIEFTVSIEEGHIKRDPMLSLVAVVIIVPIGCHEFTVFDDPEFGRKFIDEISIV